MENLFRSYPILHPNHWCLLRIALGVVVAGLAWYGAPVWLTLGILVFAMITDYIDGAVARACGLITPTGKWLDPLADKLVYLPLFALAAWTGRADIYWVLALAGADIIGTVARPWLTASATMWGKSKTCVAFALAAWMTLSPQGASWPAVSYIELAIGWLVAVLALASVISKIPRAR